MHTPSTLTILYSEIILIKNYLVQQIYVKEVLLSKKIYLLEDSSSINRIKECELLKKDIT